MINQIKPKLVLAKNPDEFYSFLAKYELSENDYMFIGNTEDDLLAMAGILKQTYGIVLTGNYKKNPMYSSVEILLNNKYFPIVQMMPIQ